MSKNDKVLEKEDHIYVAGKILISSGISRCTLCHFNHWLF